MQPALSRETATSVRAGHRAHPLALLAGGVIAGFGLGVLGLAQLLPVPDAAPILPLPEARVALSSPAAAPAARNWPAAFGTAPEPMREAPEPVVLEAPDDVDDDDDDDDYLPYDYADYRLRGMVSEPEGGWALIESERGVEVVRVGSELSGGEMVVEITDDGVLLQGFRAAFLLSFSDTSGFGEEDGWEEEEGWGDDDGWGGDDGWEESDDWGEDDEDDSYDDFDDSENDTDPDER
ncbi:MAG: hypothetical protein JJU15_10995 [Pararhodobacter sp.]|nr:hypothetical protein [Pararhodobacter sp.]